MTKKKEIKNFIYLLVVIDALLFITNYRGQLRSYNSTLLALSYEYGFTSRSLLGTLYHLVDFILPVDMMSYEAARAFALIFTLGFFALLIFFSYKMLLKVDESCIKPAEYLLLFLSIGAVTTFSFSYNFFRVDIFMMWVSLIATLLLMNEKTVWMAIPLSAIGVMFHQGFVLMYFNIILVILFYQAMNSKLKKIKTFIIFLISFVLGSGLFLWFELFSRTNGDSIFDKVEAEAKALSFNEVYHTTLLYHEVLGVDVSGSETLFYKMNHVQLFLFVICCAPIIFVLARFFINLIKGGEGVFAKLKYIAAAVGSLTILPDLIAKVDYGRWMLAVATYYIVIILAMCALGDEIVQTELESLYKKARENPWMLVIVLIPILLVPFMDVDIDKLVQAWQKWFQANKILFYTK